MKIVLGKFLNTWKKHEGEPKWIKFKSKLLLGEYELMFDAHNGSGFHNRIILNILPTWCRIKNLIKPARGLNTVKSFDGFCG